jgi:hypothetical protein
LFFFCVWSTCSPPPPPPPPTTRIPRDGLGRLRHRGVGRRAALRTLERLRVARGLRRRARLDHLGRGWEAGSRVGGRFSLCRRESDRDNDPATRRLGMAPRRLAESRLWAERTAGCSHGPRRRIVGRRHAKRAKHIVERPDRAHLLRVEEGDGASSAPRTLASSSPVRVARGARWPKGTSYRGRPSACRRPRSGTAAVVATGAARPTA